LLPGVKIAMNDSDRRLAMLMEDAEIPDRPLPPELTIAEKQYAVKAFLESKEGQAAIRSEALAIARADTRPTAGSGNPGAVRLPRNVGARAADPWNNDSMAARWDRTPEINPDTTRRIATAERMQRSSVPVAPTREQERQDHYDQMRRAVQGNAQRVSDRPRRSQREDLGIDWGNGSDAIDSMLSDIQD